MQQDELLSFLCEQGATLQQKHYTVVRALLASTYILYPSKNTNLS